MISQKISQELLQINAIKLNPQNPFIWASGIKSPIYCDNRLALSYPDVRKLIIDGFIALSKTFKPFNKIVGVATAGIPHGALLAHELNLPFIYVRSKPKSHGRKNQIEGLISKNDKYLVIEDLFSTAGSAKLAIDALRQESEGEVIAAAAIFSYGFEQVDQVSKELKIPFKSLTKYSILIEEALKLSYISAEHFELLKKWSIDPHNWMIS